MSRRLFSQLGLWIERQRLRGPLQAMWQPSSWEMREEALVKLAELSSRGSDLAAVELMRAGEFWRFFPHAERDAEQQKLRRLAQRGDELAALELADLCIQSGEYEEAARLLRQVTGPRANELRRRLTGKFW